MAGCEVSVWARCVAGVGFLGVLACSSPQSPANGGTGGANQGAQGGSNGIAQGGASVSGATSTITGGASASAAGGSFFGGAPSAISGGAPSALGGGGGSPSPSGGAPNGGTAGTSAKSADTCAAPIAGAVTFSNPGGIFEGSVSVTLSAADGAEIRYTTDHTVPTAASMLYAGTPLTFNTTTELTVQAFAAGAAVSAPQSAVYIARTFDQPHDLPVMVLDAYGKALPGASTGMFPGGQQGDREYIDVAVTTFEPNAGMTSLSAAPKLTSSAAFRIRGQSSASYPKRPYRLELRTPNGEDRDCPLFGMPAESDWVLHSPYPDKALIRNAFVYSLGPAIGIKAPRAKLVELYVNTAARALESADYQGVYLLVETIKNQKDRLDLKQLNEQHTMLPEIGGGYIFKFEWQVMDIEQRLPCPSGQANCWNWLEVTDPKPWNQPQQDYLTSYLQSFITALHSAAPADPMTGYPAFMDTGSFISQIIMHELTRNLDAYTRSQLFHKDRDGKIVAGPLWDYDLTAGVGSTSSYANMATEGWQYESVASRFPNTADWFPVLLAEPVFKAALVVRWKELRASVLSDAEVSARIAQLTSGLENAAQRNFQKWTILSTRRIGFFDTPVVDTWQAQVAAMQTWLTTRMAWLDSQWQ